MAFLTEKRNRKGERGGNGSWIWLGLGRLTEGGIYKGQAEIAKCSRAALEKSTILFDLLVQVNRGIDPLKIPIYILVLFSS